jgi:predicted XRE-type DNA-binding protein
MKKKSTDALPIVEWGSGNVFEDLGFKNPELHLVKATLVVELTKVIRKRKLSQREAAKILKVDQPKISALLKGRFTGFSTDRLIRLLVAAGQNVEIVVSPKTKTQRMAKMKVSAA